MICVSIGGRGYAACARALRGVAFAEIRLDRARLSEAETGRLFSSARAAGKKLIATCRPGRGTSGAARGRRGEGSSGTHGLGMAERKRMLLRAIDAGAAYVDVELGSPVLHAVAARARKKGCGVIVSYHDYGRTPDAAALRKAVARCFASGADIAKIACTVKSGRDNARLLGLLDDSRRIVVVGMGAKGRMTRIAAPLLGSQFTFASAGAGKETAGGQMDKAALRKAMRAVAGVQGG